MSGRWAIVASAAAATASPACCAFVDEPRNPFAEPVVVIKARKIITVSEETIEDGMIVIRGNRISSVGKQPRVPAGARIISANTVMPGIIGVYSHIGLSAAAADPAPQLPPNLPPQIAARFAGGGGRATVNAHLRVMDELYPYERDYERLPRAGVTTLALVPEGRGFPGQGAVIRPVGETTEKMALASTSPFAIGFQADTPTQDLIRTTLQGQGAGGPGGGAAGGAFGGGPSMTPDEDDFQRRQRRPVPTRGGPMPGAPSAITLAARRLAVSRAVSGETPTFIVCADSAAGLYALNLFAAFDRLKPVYVLPPECYRIAQALSAKKASVVVPAEITFEPNTRNRVNAAAELVRAGVKVACRPSADSVAGYEGLLARMAELVKMGLHRDAALKAITLHPAEMLGLDSKLGCIELSHEANLLLLDGDPFAPTTKITGVMIEGKMVGDGR